MQTPLFEMNNVIFQSGNFRALDIKKFEIHRGTVYAISGKPGSGKTVFLDIIARRIKNFTGDLKFEGKEIKEYSRKEFENQIAFVPQIQRIPWGTVQKYMSKVLGGYSHIRDDKDKRIEKVAKQMEIKHLLERPMRKLTPGQFRWVILATMIAADTKLLLIDEIEQHLSPDAMTNLVRILYRKCNYDGITVVVTTQNPEALKKMVSIYITMNSGRISSVRSASRRKRNNRS